MATPFTRPIVFPRSLFSNLLKRATEEEEEHMEVSAENISMYGGSGSFEEAHHELFKVTTEVNIVHLAFSLLSGFIVIFGMFSAFIKEKLYVGEAILAIVIGLLISPHVAGWFEPSTWGTEHTADTITLEVTRIVIALSVFAVGVELPSRYMLRHWKSLAILLGPIMLFGWLISAAFIYILVPRLNFLSALVVAACVTPTDPILAASVVGKGKFAQKHVPSHIRHLLQAESGCNDGAAFPFLYLALFLLLRGEVGVGESIGKWILLVILYQIILGIIMGAILGIAARKVMKFAKRNGLIDRESMVAMYVALAILSTALTTLAGSDDLLAAFACGTAFAWDDWFAQATEESNFSNVIDLLSNSLAFVYLGATMPVNAWSDPILSLSVWRLVVIAIAILVLRRLPVMLLFQRLCPEIKTFREALFCGHFGPMGVGAIFIATLAAERLPTPTVPAENSIDVLALSIQPIVYFIVLASVLVHGLTIPVFTGGKRMHSRVHSIGKSMSQGAEPSWLHRMKRVGDEMTPSPLEREKDTRDGDEDDSLEKAEKGDFPSSEGSRSGSNGDEVVRQQKSSGENDDSILHKKGDRQAKHEHHNPDSQGREVWREGHQLIIERADSSEDVQVVNLPERERPEHSPAPKVHVHGPHIRLPPQAAEMGERIKIDESLAAAEAHHKLVEGGSKVENALKKVGIQARRGSIGFERPHFLRGETLTEEEKEKRDAMCRGERRDVDRRGEEKTWIEGNLLIVEKEGGEDVEVIDISDFVKDPERLEYLKTVGGGRSVSTREVEQHRSGFLAQGIPATLALIKGAKKALGIPNLQQTEAVAEQDDADERRRARAADRGEGSSNTARANDSASPGKTSSRSSKSPTQSPKSAAQQIAEDARRQSAEDEEERDAPKNDDAIRPAAVDRPKPTRKDTLRKLLFKKNVADAAISETPEESAEGVIEDDRGRPSASATATPASPRSPSPTRSVRSIRFADNLQPPRSRRGSPEGANRTAKP